MSNYGFGLIDYETGETLLQFPTFVRNLTGNVKDCDTVSHIDVDANASIKFNIRDDLKTRSNPKTEEK